MTNGRMTSEQELRRRFSHLIEEEVRRGSTCPDSARLAAYAEGQLGGSAREELEEHLADCGHCLGQVRFLVRSEEIGPPPAVPARLIEAVSSRRESEASRFRRPAVGWLAAAAGLMLVVLSVRFGVIDMVPGVAPPAGERESVGVRESIGVGAGDRVVRGVVDVESVPTVVQPRIGERVRRERLTVAWEPVAGALDYSLQLMDAGGDVVWEDRTEASSTTIPPDVDLESGERYFVWVVAHLRSGLRSKSPAVDFELERE